MTNYSRRNLFQERLAKEDIQLLIDLVVIAIRNERIVDVSNERIQILVTKLERMKQQ